RWAAKEAMLSGVPITLMYLLRPEIVTWPLAPSDRFSVESEIRNAEEVLEFARRTALSRAGPGNPPAIRTEVPRSAPLAGLIDASKDAQMVVVGSRGKGTLGRLVLGSVSSGLIHHAHCPVTIVHSHLGELPDAAAPVVVGIDGSPASEAATALAFEEAARRDVDLIAVHAWSDVGRRLLQGAEWREHKQQAEEILAERLAGWQERYPDVRIQRHVDFDQPARGLIERSRTAQLVVLGSHGRG
ncbi:universal stress protein, partial [Mycobacterium sp. ITM-2017-0098]